MTEKWGDLPGQAVTLWQMLTSQLSMVTTSPGFSFAGWKVCCRMKKSSSKVLENSSGSGELADRQWGSDTFANQMGLHGSQSDIQLLNEEELGPELVDNNSLSQDSTALLFPSPCPLVFKPAWLNLRVCGLLDLPLSLLNTVSVRSGGFFTQNIKQRGQRKH